jgi:hypothetical protein
MINILTGLFGGGQERTPADIESIERDTGKKLFAFLETTKTKSGTSYREEIVSRSGHATGAGNTLDEYQEITFDRNGGDLDAFPSVKPRFAFTSGRETTSTSSVTLKFSRFMPEAEAIALSTRMWSAVDSKTRRALLVAVVDKKLEEQTRSRDRYIAEKAAGTLQPGDEDDYFRYECMPLFLTLCKRALEANKFDFVYDQDGVLTMQPKGKWQKDYELIRSAYRRNGLEPEEYESRVGVEKPTDEAMIAALKKELNQAS